ncbi:MAG: MATE family efflux transporter [Eubacteriales bacterium]|nr:MATE family efflux transporter [Eubacteriales bacterium]
MSKGAIGKNVDMTTGVVWKQLIIFAIPLILGDMLQQLYSTVDSIIVGQYVGKTALAAVTSPETLINAIIGMSSGLSLGATIMAARYFGARDDKKVSDTVHTSMAIALGIGIIMTIIGLVFAPAMLRVLKTPDDVFPEADSYLSIYFTGMIGLVVYNMASGLLRAFGDSVRPLISLGITSVINVVLDIILVVFFNMGVVGTAIATIVAIYASAIYLVIRLMETKESYRLNLLKLRYNKSIANSIYAIGIPNGIQKSLVAFSNLFVIANINAFGSGASAAWGVFRRLDSFIIHMIANIGAAESTFVSQNVGARKEDRIKESMKFSIILCFTLAAVLDILLMIFRYAFIGIFSTDPEVMYYGSIIFMTSLWFQPFNGFCHGLAGVIRGYGDGKGPSYIVILCMVVLRQIYLNIGIHFTNSIAFVVSCYPFAWVLNAIILTFYYFYKKKNGQLKLPD